MLLKATESDASPFISVVSRIVNRTAEYYKPKTLVIVQINGWFGSRWLRFSGKTLGALGVRKHHITIPPFVPSRVVAERWFREPRAEAIAPQFKIHKNVSSELALQRYVDQIIPDTALFWYSDGSVQVGKGTLMSYVPVEGEYLTWYAEFREELEWRPSKVIGIGEVEFGELCG